jgi:hypothetical protein
MTGIDIPSPFRFSRQAGARWRKRLGLLLLLPLLAALTATAQESEPPEAEEEEPPAGLVLPAISLKYSTVSALRFGVNNWVRTVVAPPVLAGDGKLYGVDWVSSSVGNESFLFRFDTDGGNTEIVHQFGRANNAPLNVVETPNGDLYGIVNLLRWSHCIFGQPTNDRCLRPALGLRGWRLPAGGTEVQYLDEASDPADLPLLLSGDSGEDGRGGDGRHGLSGMLVFNPVDGNIYGLSQVGGNAIGSLAVYRLRVAGADTRLEIVYVFPSSETPVAPGVDLRVTPLSIAVEPDTGHLAVMARTFQLPSSGVSAADNPYSGALFRLDPAAPPASGELAPVHLFSRDQIPAFYSGGGLNPYLLGSGYLVDDGDGWWYGNAASSTVLNTESYGEIFRIRHDGSDFQVVHRFEASCVEDAANVSDEPAGPPPADGEAPPCTLEWLQGNRPLGPLVRAADGLIYGTTGFGGTGSGIGVVFRLFPQYADEEGGSFQVVRPFRVPVQGIEAAAPYGLVAAPDGKLYGLSASNMRPSGSGGSDNVFYSLEFDAADIDLGISSAAATWPGFLYPGDEFTVSWWAYLVTRCDTFSRSATGWSGEDVGITGTRTMSTMRAGHHIHEIICQNDTGSVYMEKSFTVPVISRPLTAEEVLAQLDYGNGAGSFDWLTLLLLLAALVLFALPPRTAHINQEKQR